MLGAIHCGVQNPCRSAKATGPNGKLSLSPMTSPPLPQGTTLSQAQRPTVNSFLLLFQLRTSLIRLLVPEGPTVQELHGKDI